MILSPTTTNALDVCGTHASTPLRKYLCIPFSLNFITGKSGFLPVSNTLNIRTSRQGRCTDIVSKTKPRSGATARVRSNVIACLTFGQIQSYCDHGLGLDREVERIRNNEGSVWDDNARISTEGDRFESVCLDGIGSGRAIRGQCNSHGSDRKVIDPECIRDPDSDLIRRNGHVKGLTNCGIKENETCFILRKSARTLQQGDGDSTNGGGGRLAGSVSCGMVVHVSTQWFPLCTGKASVCPEIRETTKQITAR